MTGYARAQDFAAFLASPPILPVADQAHHLALMAQAEAYLDATYTFVGTLDEDHEH